MREKKYKVVTSDGKVRITINIDPTILDELDQDRKKMGLSRSGWIVIAFMHFLKKRGNDEKLNQ